MNTSRRLSLKREALRDLTAEELDAVAGGTLQTKISCLDYITCFPCLRVTLNSDCIEA